MDNPAVTVVSFLFDLSLRATLMDSSYGVIMGSNPIHGSPYAEAVDGVVDYKKVNLLEGPKVPLRVRQAASLEGAITFCVKALLEPWWGWGMHEAGYSACLDRVDVRVDRKEYDWY
jgi:hypothetical protein